MLILAALPYWATAILVALFLFVCVLMILAVLIQRPSGGGLSGAFGSGAGSGQTAFGAKTGDALTYATIGIFFFYLLFAVGLNFATRPSKAAPAGATPAGSTAPIGGATPATGTGASTGAPAEAPASTGATGPTGTPATTGTPAAPANNTPASTGAPATPPAAPAPTGAPPPASTGGQ